MSSPGLEHAARVPVVCFTELSPKLDLKKHLACVSCRFVSSNGTEIVSEVWSVTNVKMLALSAWDSVLSGPRMSL